MICDEYDNWLPGHRDCGTPFPRRCGSSVPCRVTWCTTSSCALPPSTISPACSMTRRTVRSPLLTSTASSSRDAPFRSSCRRASGSLRCSRRPCRSERRTRHQASFRRTPTTSATTGFFATSGAARMRSTRTIEPYGWRCSAERHWSTSSASTAECMCRGTRCGSSERISSAGSSPVDVGQRLADLDALAAPQREYVRRLTTLRLHQPIFRARVLRAYGEACAMCRLRHAELLDAAHILPDTHPRGTQSFRTGSPSARSTTRRTTATSSESDPIFRSTSNRGSSRRSMGRCSGTGCRRWAAYGSSCHDVLTPKPTRTGSASVTASFSPSARCYRTARRPRVTCWASNRSGSKPSYISASSRPHSEASAGLARASSSSA